MGGEDAESPPGMGGLTQKEVPISPGLCWPSFPWGNRLFMLILLDMPARTGLNGSVNGRRRVESGLSLRGWEFTHKQGQAAKMAHGVTGCSWRAQRGLRRGVEADGGRQRCPQDPVQGSRSAGGEDLEATLPCVTSPPSAQILVLTQCSSRGIWAPWSEWLCAGAGATPGSLEHPVLPESKGVGPQGKNLQSRNSLSNRKSCTGWKSEV